MPTAAEALTRLRAALDAGEYPPGARMPPERDLASRMGIGRGTLRKAFDALAREGRIRRRVGQGTFVADAAAHRAALRLAAPPSPAEVMETRRLVEPQIASLAALRAAAPEIARLRRLAEEGAALSWRDWEEHDAAFHAALAEAGRNPLLVGLLETLREMRLGEDWGRLRRRALTPERQRRHLRQHRAVVEAVAGRDPAGAAEAMRAHLDFVHAALIDAAPMLETAP